MCGIVGCIGQANANEFIIKGLKRLEYRGYDSAGIAYIPVNLEKIQVHKVEGTVDALEEKIQGQDGFNLAIGHTRWATHGAPSEVNAHPHLSMHGKLAIVHNGIIENCEVLRKELQEHGYLFLGQTDSEVLANFIEHIQISQNCSLEDAICSALQLATGSYAIAAINKEDNSLIVARKGSPLVIGMKEQSYFIASDKAPLVSFAEELFELDESSIAVLSPGKPAHIFNIDSKEHAQPNIEKLELTLSEIEKGDYETFMLKEIYEQPAAIHNTISGRINSEDGSITFGGIADHLDKIVAAPRIVIVACGTSWHAGLIGRSLIEKMAQTQVIVEIASEFAYKDPLIYPNDVVIGISQSGETADTITALNVAKEKGAMIMGICNVAGSKLSSMTDCGIYTKAGVETGVASTKAFTTQVVVLQMLALLIAKQKGTMPQSEIMEKIAWIEKIPELVKESLQINEQVEKIAESYLQAENTLYLGRDYNYPIALEGALKLKEISYVHAEGYPAAEMKHGPIALIDKNMPVIVIAPSDGIFYDKIIANIEQVRSREGKIISIVSHDDTQITAISDHTIRLPKCDAFVTPIISSVFLQLYGYHIAMKRGLNVDKPRNLAKSVTVE